jgi:hypothetical protein
VPPPRLLLRAHAGPASRATGATVQPEGRVRGVAAGRAVVRRLAAPPPGVPELPHQERRHVVVPDQHAGLAPEVAAVGVPANVVGRRRRGAWPGVGGSPVNEVLASLRQLRLGGGSPRSAPSGGSFLAGGYPFGSLKSPAGLYSLPSTPPTRSCPVMVTTASGATIMTVERLNLGLLVCWTSTGVHLCWRRSTRSPSRTHTHKLTHVLAQFQTQDIWCCLNGCVFCVLFLLLS